MSDPDIKFTTNLRGQNLEFHSTWGLFSPKEIDGGTRLLIKHMQVEDDDLSIDLGCGYGPVGLTAAKLSKQGFVHLVDKDFVAIEFAQRNAHINNVENCKIYLSNGFSHVPNKVKFDNVFSNLPAKSGKELFFTFFEDAGSCLSKGGRFYVVTHSGLKEFIKRNFREFFGNYTKIKQSKGYTLALAKKY